MLHVLHDRLTSIDVDVYSDDPWPPDVEWAMAELSDRAVEQRGRFAKRFGWAPSVTVRLNPSVDRDLDLAAAIAPYTIAMTGVASSGDIVVSADDTGSSFVVELTPAEHTAVLAQIAELGVSRELLVVFEG
ncbi:hypothetical protein [Cellulosimicrobium sp. Marseille-Q8652]